MPIKESAKKELRKGEKRNELNRERSKKMKDLVKKVQKLVVAGKLDEAKKLLPDACQAIDKACKRGVIKNNNAGRKKSSLMKLVNKK